LVRNLRRELAQRFSLIGVQVFLLIFAEQIEEVDVCARGDV
jgi:hypothetical protein